MNRTTLFFVVLTFIEVGSVAVFCQPTRENQMGKEAHAKIEAFIASHPEPLVREKLSGWYKSGALLFAGSIRFPAMAAASLEKNNRGETKVIIWYNTASIIDVPEARDPKDKNAYLQLVLYHEAVHVDEHFSGRLNLGPLIEKDPVKSIESLKGIWDREWVAVSKEWVFAKKIGKPHLVPVIYMATRGGENARTFLDGFYQLQMTGEAVKLNPTLRMFFTSRYKEEIAKLPK